MPIFYLESSALIKWYVVERGSDFVEELLTKRRPHHHFVISVLAVVEHKSAVTRLAKHGRLSHDEMRTILARFVRDSAIFSTIVRVEDGLLEGVGSVLDRHPLRSLDAIHFASIERVRDIALIAGERFYVVASDKELLSACRKEGIETLDPEEADASARLSRI